MIIDEALSAGDAAFKHKCTEKINELCARDCTVLIVSHGLETVRALASRCLWLERGALRFEGAASDVISAYLDEEHIDETDPTAFEDV
jgi:teichoic acid transport system ATP-binding protein